jgi:hypothetical protein
MPVKIRILSSANKTMQRLGYLKFMAQNAARTETSNVAALGQHLTSAVTKRIKVSPPFSAPLLDYVRIRLFDRVYTELRKAVLEPKNNAPVGIELQDLYLSDPTIPSTTGKLSAEGDSRHYPYFATALDLIKPGTWSVMTRSFVLIALTPKEQLTAFDAYAPQANPFLLSKEQQALFLYCFLDNDAEILYPLFQGILAFKNGSFGEREVGDLLPGIIRQSASALSQTSLTFEDKERLEKLGKVADNIERQRGKPYSGGGAREQAVRARLEPYCDMGLLTKPDRHRFTYQITAAFSRLMTNWPGAGDATDNFLEYRFFTTLAGMHGFAVSEATELEARNALRDAGEQLKSTLGYSPIRDCSLLAGIRLLFDHQRVLELGTSHDVLRTWQKAAPDIVRFTVDRMGELAYVKFLKPAAQPGPARP